MKKNYLSNINRKKYAFTVWRFAITRRPSQIGKPWDQEWV